MGARNLTVRLDEEVIRKARIVAASRGTSISKLVSATIEQIVHQSDEYDRARRRELTKMSDGYSMGTGGTITWSREEVHERR